MISEYYIIFLCVFAYYMLFRCIKSETIGEAILAGFSCVIASIMGIIGNWQVGIILADGTQVATYFDQFAFMFYPTVVLGIIVAVMKTMELIKEEAEDSLRGI